MPVFLTITPSYNNFMLLFLTVTPSYNNFMLVFPVLDLLGGLGGVKPPQSFFKPSQLVHFFTPGGVEWTPPTLLVTYFGCRVGVGVDNNVQHRSGFRVQYLGGSGRVEPKNFFNSLRSPNPPPPVFFYKSSTGCFKL